MNNNYNYNNNQMGGVPNQNPTYNNNQPMNYGPQPMPNPSPNNGQPNNMTPGYGYNYQPSPKFKFPAIAKDTASIIGYIGAIIMAIGCFMNFVTLEVSVEGYSSMTESVTVNYFITDGTIKDGAFVLVAAIAALLLIHFRKNLFALIPTAIGGLVLIADLVGVKDIIDSYTYSSYFFTYNVDTQYGPAPFLIGIGIVAIIVHAVLFFQNKNKTTTNNTMIQQPNNMMPNQNMNYNNQVNYGPQPCLINL